MIRVPQRRRPPPRPPDERQYRWGPVTKQRDRTVSINAAEDAAISLVNVWIRDADTDFPAIVGRPPFVIAGETMGAVAVQWIGQLSQADGTEISAVIAGGEIWTYNHGTDALTKVVETADLTTASVTLSASARVHACEFADELIFNDGVNQPFAWDGTAGDSGLTAAVGPATAYGRPWVHAGKLWFIKGSERSTVVWSEEGVATTGYEASGYTNAWTLRQTATEGFYAGAGTNEGLYLFRGNSATLIRGEVTSNFSSTGTDEAVGEHVGSRSPDGVLNLSGVLYFLSNDRRVLRLDAGGFHDVGIGARARLASLNTTQLERAFVELVDFAEQGERIVIAIPETGSDDCNAYIIVNPATGLCEGTWTGWKSTAFGRWKNAAGEWRLVHGGGDAAATVDDGMVYIHDVPNGLELADEFPAGDVPISVQVETNYSAKDVNLEKGFTEGAAVFAVPTGGLSGITVAVITPRGETSLTTALSTGTVGGFILDQDQLDIDSFGSESGESRVAFGLRGIHGRWARLRYAHATLNERFALLEHTLTATMTERRPTVN